jgi:arsenate reductase
VPKIQAQFKPALAAVGLSGKPGKASLYWELVNAQGTATANLGAASATAAGKGTQMADVQYYASGTYYTFITLYQLWPTTANGKPATLIWRGDLISAAELGRLRGIERNAAGSAMAKEVVKTIAAFQKEYELGQRSLIDLLNAQNQFFNASVSLTSARGVIVFADYQLLAAMGTLIEYLKAPPSRERLKELVAAMNIPVRALLREKGTPCKELGLDDPKWTDEQLIDHMLAHPILINRPIVVTPLATRLCRPSEAVLDILPLPQRGAFSKEDGEQVINERGERVTRA